MKSINFYYDNIPNISRLTIQETYEFYVSNDLIPDDRLNYACDDCVNCYCCYDCKMCRNCIMCVGCLGCENCRNCAECSYSRTCESCNKCDICDYCSDCENCNSCKYCSLQNDFVDYFDSEGFNARFRETMFLTN